MKVGYRHWMYRLVVSSTFVGIIGIVSACTDESIYDGNVVFTQLPVENVNDVQLEGLDYKYAHDMKIVMASIGTSLENMKVLTSDFYSARAPEISYDGKAMVFSGQKDASSSWQIWVMNFDKMEFTRVTQSDQNCTDPTWLPDGRIAFSKFIEDENTLKYHALYTIDPSGCCEQRITFQPHEDINASVMHDGRILISSRQVYPEPGDIKYLALRPDGTKAELFYQPGKDSKFVTKATEDGNGQVVFSESGISRAIQFSRPLHTGENLLKGDFGKVLSICFIGMDEFLVAMKHSAERSFGLGLIHMSNPGKEYFYYSDSDYHIVEVTFIRERQLPKKMPSRVNLELESGFIFCMNADDSNLPINLEHGKTAKVKVLGIEREIGEANVEDDGSFYVELKADESVRFLTLNAFGDTLRGPSSWMWVRPNERRGCVGCHQDREIAPENVVPKAIEKAPVAMIK